jgi:hypothetical protein
MRLWMATLLVAPLWGQAASTAEIAQQIRRIQATLANPDIAESDDARQKDFARMESLVSNYVIAQVEAASDITRWVLRDRLIQILGVNNDGFSEPDHFHEPPYVFFLGDPVFRKSGPMVFSVVYDDAACPGSGCDRVVIESYVLDHGKVRLAGRGGAEINGIDGRAQQVESDELLVQGLLTWSSGRKLPFKAALYRVTDSGVKMVWQTPIEADLDASYFQEHLFVEHYDFNRETGPTSNPRDLDVYSLDNGVPRLVFIANSRMR